MTLGTVVVGAGQSGLNVAIRLRALGYDKPITLIGEEAHLPYQRPPLSKKFLAGELDAKSLLLRPADFYQDQRIDLKIGMRGTAIDTRERRIDLSDGSALAYEDLVLATGTRARELPLALTAGLQVGDALGGCVAPITRWRSSVHWPRAATSWWLVVALWGWRSRRRFGRRA